MSAAHAAHLSFVGITDHNVPVDDAAIALDPPDLAIIPGEELSTYSGHFEALGLPPGWPRPDGLTDRPLLASAGAAGAFRVLTHPFSTRIPWTDWQTADFEGIEIWNADEIWRRSSFLDVLVSLVAYPVNSQWALLRLARTPEENFKKWDELLAVRPVVGMCGSDAHAEVRLGRVKLLHFPGYLAVFRTGRTHVLLRSASSTNSGAPSPDGGLSNGTEIVQAMRTGHLFCGVDSLGSSSGFETHVASGGLSGGPGDSVAWSGTGRIHVQVPGMGTERGAVINPLIKVIRDGKEIVSKQASVIDEAIEGPGDYRTEVFLRQPALIGKGRWTLWIFSNPTYVTPTGSTPGIVSPETLETKNRIHRGLAAAATHFAMKAPACGQLRAALSPRCQAAPSPAGTIVRVN
jgi:hypothetical protein